jgi:hypothetical protein
VGRIEPCGRGGDGPVCCVLFCVLGCFGYEWADSDWVSSIFRRVTPTGSGFGWGYTDARSGRYLCVVAVLRFPLLDRP